MRGYKDTGTTHKDWYIGEIEVVRRAYDVQFEGVGRTAKVCYRKIREDAKIQPTSKEVSDAIELLIGKIVVANKKRRHPTLGRDINVQRVTPIQKKRSINWRLLVAIAMLGFIAYVAVSLTIDFLRESHYGKYYIKPEVSPLQFYDYDSSESWLKPAPAYASQEPPATHLSNQNPEEVERLIWEHFGVENGAEALECAKAESGLRAGAINYNRNGSIDRGIFQVNSIHCGKIDGNCADALFDVEKNIEMAKSIFDDRGWQAWYACKKFW